MVRLYNTETGQASDFAAVDALEILGTPGSVYAREAKGSAGRVGTALVLAGVSGAGLAALEGAGVTLPFLLERTYEEIRVDLATSLLEEHDWTALAKWHAASLEKERRMNVSLAEKAGVTSQPRRPGRPRKES